MDALTLEPIGFRQSLLRNLILAVPFGPFIAAFTMRDGPRWGDGWANTRVIWKKYRHRPVFDPRGRHCLKCGYDMTGNVTGRCPECFTWFRLPEMQLTQSPKSDANGSPVQWMTDEPPVQ